MQFISVFTSILHLQKPRLTTEASSLLLIFLPLHLLFSSPFSSLRCSNLFCPSSNCRLFPLWMERRSELCLWSVEKSELNAAQAVCHADGCAVVLIGCNASEMFLRPLPYSLFLLLPCSGLCHSSAFDSPYVFPLFVCHWISSAILSSPLLSSLLLTAEFMMDKMELRSIVEEPVRKCPVPAPRTSVPSPCASPSLQHKSKSMQSKHSCGQQQP